MTIFLNIYKMYFIFKGISQNARNIVILHFLHLTITTYFSKLKTFSQACLLKEYQMIN